MKSAVLRIGVCSAFVVLRSVAPLSAQATGTSYDPGFWEQYWGYVIAAVALGLIQMAFIAGLLVQRSRRRETEARNTAILRALPDLMFLLDRNDVYVDFHAPDGSALYAAADQFIGRSMREVLPPEAVGALAPLLQRARESGTATIAEYSLQMPDALRHYEARIVPANNDQLLSIVRDVTESKRADAALRESQQRYALATAAGSVGVWDWNVETDDIFVDPALKTLLGYEDCEIRNHLDDWGRRIHPAGCAGRDGAGAGAPCRRDADVRSGAPDAAQGRERALVPGARIDGAMERGKTRPRDRDRHRHH